MIKEGSSMIIFMQRFHRFKDAYLDLRFQHAQNFLLPKSQYDTPARSIVNFHEFSMNELVLKAALIKSEKLTYEDRRITLTNDYPSEVMEKHIEYKEIR